MYTSDASVGIPTPLYTSFSLFYDLSYTSVQLYTSRTPLVHLCVHLSYTSAYTSVHLSRTPTYTSRTPLVAPPYTSVHHSYTSRTPLVHLPTPLVHLPTPLVLYTFVRNTHERACNVDTLPNRNDGSLATSHTLAKPLTITHSSKRRWCASAANSIARAYGIEQHHSTRFQIPPTLSQLYSSHVPCVVPVSQRRSCVFSVFLCSRSTSRSCWTADHMDSETRGA